jgi:hypothetical protein
MFEKFSRHEKSAFALTGLELSGKNSHSPASEHSEGRSHASNSATRILSVDVSDQGGRVPVGRTSPTPQHLTEISRNVVSNVLPFHMNCECRHRFS